MFIDKLESRILLTAISTPAAHPLFPFTPEVATVMPYFPGTATPTSNNFGAMTEAEKQEAKDRTKGFEGGIKNHVYEDTTGNMTVGVGHKMPENATQAEKDEFERITGKKYDDVRNGLADLTDAQANALYDSDWNKAYNQTKNEIPNFDNLHPDAKKALVDLVFNMGSLTKFPSMKEALSRLDYGQAAWDLMHQNRNTDSPPSQYAGQVGSRARSNEGLLQGSTTTPN